MFRWLKKKATAAAQKQCRLNIRLNTKTLISVANRIDAKIVQSGGTVSPSDQQSAQKAQEALLTDIILGISNGLTLEEIQASIVNPILDEEELSEGARIAVKHVLQSAADSQ